MIQALKTLAVLGQATLPLLSVELMGLFTLLAAIIQNALIEIESDRKSRTSADATTSTKE